MNEICNFQDFSSFITDIGTIELMERHEVGDTGFFARQTNRRDKGLGMNQADFIFKHPLL